MSGYNFLSAAGNTDSMFEINETSGEVRLQQNAVLVPLTTLSYDLTIAAYSEWFDPWIAK